MIGSPHDVALRWHFEVINMDGGDIKGGFQAQSTSVFIGNKGIASGNFVQRTIKDGTQP